MSELLQTITAIQERILKISTECIQIHATLSKMNKDDERYSETGLFIDAMKNIKEASDALDYADSLLCADLVTENAYYDVAA